MRFLLSAGEASGDLYGAQLIAALRKRLRNAEFFGVGGERMRQAGCDIVVDAREVSVLGLAEVLTSLPRIRQRFHDVVRAADERRADAAVLIDFPDFNLRLAKQLHGRGIPVVYYVSPQVWAWRPWRVRDIQRYVHKMLVIFSFERPWYAERGVNVEFVGHPLADAPDPQVSREEFAAKHRLDPRRQWIALLPGSRQSEIRRNLFEMISAAVQLGTGYEYIVPVASTVAPQWLENRIRMLRGGAGEPARDFVEFTLVDDARAALKHARAAVVASGTATVEAALLGTPLVMVYRVSPLTWLFGRRLVRVPHFAMPNLIAGHEVVPELVQNDFTAENVVANLREVIADGAARERVIAGLAEVRENLGSASAGTTTAADRAAEVVIASF
jgi:lipid-A-disaccharide synthase